MPKFLITGANRGLGLEFVRQYKEAGWDVVATTRGSSAELEALGVEVNKLEMSDLDAVERFGKRFDRLDLLIANAGTYGPREVRDAKAGRQWAETFVVNTIAPSACPVGSSSGQIRSREADRGEHEDGQHR